MLYLQPGRCKVNLKKFPGYFWNLDHNFLKDSIKIRLKIVFVNFVQ